MGVGLMRPNGSKVWGLVLTVDHVQVSGKLLISCHLGPSSSDGLIGTWQDRKCSITMIRSKCRKRTEFLEAMRLQKVCSNTWVIIVYDRTHCRDIWTFPCTFSFINKHFFHCFRMVTRMLRVGTWQENFSS